MSDTKTIELIRKLLAVANDKAASENEAAMAMQKAQALMLKHGIKSINEETGKVEWGKRIVDLEKAHHYFLAKGCALLYNCKFIWNDKSQHHFCFVGRPENHQAAEMTVYFIADQIERLYKAMLPKGMSKTERAQWRREFKHAASVRVYVRIGEMVSALQKNDKVAQEQVGCTALVVKNHMLALIEEADEFLAGKISTKNARGRSMAIKTTHGGVAGFAAGGKVNINQAIKPTDLPLALTDGRK